MKLLSLFVLVSIFGVFQTADAKTFRKLWGQKCNKNSDCENNNCVKKLCSVVKCKDDIRCNEQCGTKHGYSYGSKCKYQSVFRKECNSE